MLKVLKTRTFTQVCFKYFLQHCCVIELFLCIIQEESVNCACTVEETWEGDLSKRRLGFISNPLQMLIYAGKLH